MKRKQQEHRMPNHRLFTTGAFVVPAKVKINGIVTWRWIVDSFEDDSFFDGKIFNPPEYADDFDKLIIPSDDD